MESITINGATYDGVKVIRYIDSSGNVRSVNELILNGASAWKKPFSLDAVLNNNSWESILAAAKSGVAKDVWSVGDVKQITFYYGGESITETVRIIGFDHDDLSENDEYYGDDSYNNGTNKASVTFEFEKLHFLGSISSNTSYSGWSDYSLRNVTLPEIKNNFPEALKNGIRKISKKTAWNNFSTATEDELFVLSNAEFGSGGDKDGQKYAYYTDDASRIKYVCEHSDELTVGRKGVYWTRTPYSYAKAYRIGTSGEQGVGVSVSQSLYYVPAFCI